MYHIVQSSERNGCHSTAVVDDEWWSTVYSTRDPAIPPGLFAVGIALQSPSLTLMRVRPPLRAHQRALRNILSSRHLRSLSSSCLARTAGVLVSSCACVRFMIQAWMFGCFLVLQLHSLTCTVPTLPRCGTRAAGRPTTVVWGSAWCMVGAAHLLCFHHLKYLITSSR